MRTTTLAYVLAPVLAVVTTILPNHVSAAEAPRAQAVTIADLDLASASGQRELDTRIRRGAFAGSTRRLPERMFPKPGR